MTRVAIIGGRRTPFVKAGGKFAKKTFLELGIHAVEGTVKALDLDPESIEELIYSTVMLDPRTPNAARELTMRSSLPKSLPAHFISNNCISGLVAVNMISEAIRSGRIRIGIAGGSESLSRPTLTLRDSAEEFFIGLARAKTLGQRLGLLTKFRPGMIMPQPPSPREPSTGLTMGQHQEITSKEFEVPREAQDRLAYASHMNGAKAKEQGFLSQEIVPVDGVSEDDMIRPGTSLEKLTTLKPVFDRTAAGTLTAGNSSPLTDGASAVCLMAEEEAKRQGREILGYIEGVEFAAIDPADGLLMAPALALPRLMHKHGLTTDNVDVFEVHEAFASQVLSNMAVWANGWDKYPDVKPIGTIPDEKLNVNGGSIAIGHPFAATGGRLIVSLVNQLTRAGKNTGVISVCAAGAMGCAMLIRRS